MKTSPNGRTPTDPISGPLLREVNDRIREVGEGFDFPGAGLEFLCECGAHNCVATVELRPEDYDRLRTDNADFVIAAGHQRAAAR